MESQNIEFKAVIKFLTKEGAKAKEIHWRMADVYGDSSPKYFTVAKWSAEFKRGRDSLEDDPRPSHPADVISQEMIDHVERLVLNNRQIKVVELASECGISNGSVYTIILEHLGMPKISARWVLRNQNMQDRQQRVESSQELLEVYNANPEDFHTHLVTRDETWLHHWDPDTKESMQWKHPGSPLPKKSRTQPSPSKVMATVLWDSKGIILIDYKPAGTSITGEYYANVIEQLGVAIKEKRSGKLAAGVLLLHDNAPVLKSRVAQAAIRECKFEQLNHPPYSPDLAPSDYYLFQNLKSHLCGSRFLDDDELKAAIEAWFEDKIDDFYFKGIGCLNEKWAKCIEVKGDYIEK